MAVGPSADPKCIQWDSNSSSPCGDLPSTPPIQGVSRQDSYTIQLNWFSTH